MTRVSAPTVRRWGGSSEGVRGGVRPASGKSGPKMVRLEGLCGRRARRRCARRRVRRRSVPLSRRMIRWRGRLIRWRLSRCLIRFPLSRCLIRWRLSRCLIRWPLRGCWRVLLSGRGWLPSWVVWLIRCGGFWLVRRPVICLGWGSGWSTGRRHWPSVGLMVWMSWRCGSG